jgi:hypothetical protein
MYFERTSRLNGQVEPGRMSSYSCWRLRYRAGSAPEDDREEQGIFQGCRCLEWSIHERSEPMRSGVLGTHINLSELSSQRA